MGLLTGSSSFRRYRVRGELPPDFRDRFVEAVQHRAFKENLDARSGEDNVGWVNLVDDDDTTFTLNKILFNNYLTLGLRVDKKRVPARLLKILAERRCREIREAKGVERMSASHKRDVKEALEEDLLGRALPAVAVYDMAWDINAAELRFYATGDAINDLFRTFFKDTFALDLVRLKLCHWLEPRGLALDQQADVVSRLRPELFDRP